MGIFSGVEEEKALWGRKNTTFLAILLHSFINHLNLEMDLLKSHICPVRQIFSIIKKLESVRFSESPPLIDKII